MDKIYIKCLIDKNMSSSNIFSSFGNSVDKWPRILKEILKHLNLDYNQRNNAFDYIAFRLEKITKDNGSFTKKQFDAALLDIPSRIMSKEQTGNLKILARGGRILEPKAEPKFEIKKEKTEESNQANEPIEEKPSGLLRFLGFKMPNRKK